MKTRFTLLLCICMAGLLAQHPAPAPSTTTVTFSGKSKGLVTRAEVAGTDKLVVMTNDTIVSSIIISSYKFSVFRKGGLNPILDVSIKSDSVTQYFKDCLLASPAGSKFYIEYIVARVVPGPSERRLAPLSFELAD